MRTLVDDSLLGALDAVAREESLLAREPSRALLAAIRAVSGAYNALGSDDGARRPSVGTREALAARLHFFLPRDLGKTYEAARDLLVRLPEAGVLRVVDVGAGLGASALGLACLLRETRPKLNLDLTLVDDDRVALGIAERLFARLFPVDRVTVRVAVANVAGFTPPAEVELVLASNVLCEVESAGASALADGRGAAMVARWVRATAPKGHVLIVEPALRRTARSLQGLRGRMLAAGFSIVGPCTHDGACPLLVDARDWCHEDRAVSLPPALIPLARGAGLHFEGLSFAYLAVTRESLDIGRARGRVVAPPREAKGKRGLTLCHAGQPPADGIATTYERLTRHRGPDLDVWQGASRGSVLALDPWPTGARVEPGARVTALAAGER